MLVSEALPMLIVAFMLSQHPNAIVYAIGLFMGTLMPKSGLVLKNRIVYKLFFLQTIYKISSLSMTNVSLVATNTPYLISVVKIPNPLSQFKISSGPSEWSYHGTPLVSLFSNKPTCFNPSQPGTWSNSVFLRVCCCHFNSIFQLHHS